jgi:exodeoxyribonuclease VII large subunit
MVRRLTELWTRVERARRSAILQDPRRILRQSQQQLDELTARLGLLIRHRFQLARGLVESLRGRLDILNPLAILSRGYSFTRSLADGRILTSSTGLKPGDQVETRLKEGRIISKVIEME